MFYANTNTIIWFPEYGFKILEGWFGRKVPGPDRGGPDGGIGLKLEWMRAF
jgi:hypothetical protein